MKCEKCGREIKPGEVVYTAAGFVQCKECDDKSNHTVSMDDIFSKIIAKKSE